VSLSPLPFSWDLGEIVSVCLHVGSWEQILSTRGPREKNTREIYLPFLSIEFWTTTALFIFTTKGICILKFPAFPLGHWLHHSGIWHVSGLWACNKCYYQISRKKKNKERNRKENVVVSLFKQILKKYFFIF